MFRHKIPLKIFAWVVQREFSCFGNRPRTINVIVLNYKEPRNMGRGGPKAASNLSTCHPSCDDLKAFNLFFVFSPPGL